MKWLYEAHGSVVEPSGAAALAAVLSGAASIESCADHPQGDVVRALAYFVVLTMHPAIPHFRPVTVLALRCDVAPASLPAVPSHAAGKGEETRGKPWGLGVGAVTTYSFASPRRNLGLVAGHHHQRAQR